MENVKSPCTVRHFYWAAIELSSGDHGRFAQYIGKAYLEATAVDAEKLRHAFLELFEMSHSWIDYSETEE